MRHYKAGGDTMSTVLTKHQLAARFAVSVRTVDRWVANGCPVMRPSAGVTRFNPETVEAWASKRKQPATPEKGTTP